MKILLYIIAVLGVLTIALFVWTSFQVLAIEADYPPSGQFVKLANGNFHFSDTDAHIEDKPPVLFVHGASGNLLDQQIAFANAMAGKARAIVVDRPGYGYSTRGEANTPAKQAGIYRELLDRLEVEKVVLVGHSLGTASVAAFAVLYPERVKGIVFVSPATHPWPGGVTWYYDIASIPVLGHLFTETLVLPMGMQSMDSGAKAVFEPQIPPATYVEQAALPLILRPHSFRANSIDVAGLNDFVSDFSKRYSEINVPVVIITGDKDDIVSPDIHSVGLERDIKNAKLIILPGIGHKPDYTSTDTIVDAIAEVSR